LIHSPVGVLAALTGICAFFFFLEARTRWVVFKYFPPLLWIYAVPVVLNNVGVLPAESAAYDVLKEGVLPAFLVLMLVSVDLRSALRVMGRGIAVMLVGSFGVVIGAALTYALVRGMLSPDAWKQFGALSGAWIGGTGNMAAVAGGMGLEPTDLGVAILADNVVYIVWLPILLGSKGFAERFNRWAKVAPERVAALEAAAKESEETPKKLTLQHVLYLCAVVAAVTLAADVTSSALPEIEPVLSRGTWRTLAITTFALALSFTKIREIPGARPAGLGLVYLFLAGMGARATISGLGDAPVFLAASFLWMAIHGGACLLGARLLRVDIHTAAIASAANIGGAASAPVVAAHHNEALVPASILMALVGYSAGNYLAVLTSQLCYWVSTI